MRNLDKNFVPTHVGNTEKRRPSFQLLKRHATKEINKMYSVFNVGFWRRWEKDARRTYVLFCSLRTYGDTSLPLMFIVCIVVFAVLVSSAVDTCAACLVLH